MHMFTVWQYNDLCIFSCCSCTSDHITLLLPSAKRDVAAQLLLTDFNKSYQILVFGCYYACPLQYEASRSLYFGEQAHS